jgi:hypothetical protein
MQFIINKYKKRIRADRGGQNSELRKRQWKGTASGAFEFTLSQEGTLLLYPVASIMESNRSSVPSINLAPVSVISFIAPTTL